MALGWEDFPVGKSIITQGITVTESHITQFSGLTGDMYPAHSNAIWAERSPFEQRIAHGPLTFSLAVGCMFQSGFYGDAIIAWLSGDKMRATAPVLIGDTIQVNATVVHSRPTKDGQSGVVELDYTVTNQHSKTVMTISLTMLMRNRPTH